MTNDNSVYYTVAEVAEKLRVCKMTIYRLVKDGTLEAKKVSPRALRILASSVHEKYPELAPSAVALAAHMDAAATYGAAIEQHGITRA